MIPTNRGTFTPSGLADELAYINYAHNRDIAPHVTPERWAKVYGEAAVAELEARYQAEKVIERARA